MSIRHSAGGLTGHLLLASCEVMRGVFIVESGTGCEARTKAEFKIRSDSWSGLVVWTEGADVIVNRHAFVDCLRAAILQLGDEVNNDLKDITGNRIRFNLARTLDWTFGLCDDRGTDSLKGKADAPWWEKGNFTKPALPEEPKS